MKDEKLLTLEDNLREIAKNLNTRLNELKAQLDDLDCFVRKEIAPRVNEIGIE